MPRIFVAVRASESVTEAVRQTQEALRSRVHDVKWVDTGNLHLTLRFFGAIDETRLQGVSHAVQSVAQLAKPFTVELAGVGCFPPKGRPRVIWVGIRQGARPLVQLAQQLEQAFGEAGLGREERPFRPHLTIGRLRGPDRRRGQRRSKKRFGPLNPEQAVPEIHQTLGLVSCGPLSMPVASLQVVESELRPEGPHYTDRQVAELGRGGP